MSTASLARLRAEIKACRRCEDDLPLGARPVLRASVTARLLIIGQAPGTRVHETGIPWNDPSGDKLRDWLALDKETFYDAAQIAIVPMGFCYPGRLARGGDVPPRPECAEAWHAALLDELPEIRLTLLVGAYAQARYLGARRGKTLGETVACWRDFLPGYLPLPHPSWRTTAWLRKHPHFEAELLPEARRLVGALLIPTVLGIT